MRSLPKSIEIHVNPQIVYDLFKSASNLHPYKDSELRNYDVQNYIHDNVRLMCPESFDDIMKNIQYKINQIPYFVIVKGLKFDRNYSLLIALSSSLGKLIEPYNKPGFSLIHHLKPTQYLDNTIEEKLDEKLHTDGTNWTHPNDITGLLCVRPDQYGGAQSQILDIDSIYLEIKRHFSLETIRILENMDLPWRSDDGLSNGLFWAPIISNKNIRWMRYTINKAIEEYNIHNLPASLIKSLNAIEYVTLDSKKTYNFKLTSGDLLFFNNKKVLHSRSPYPYPQFSSRLLLRIKIISFNRVNY